MQQPYSRHVLKNGIRVILVPQKKALAATVLVLVETGSKYETKEINGVSHFLEHLCFKGTKKRPTALAITSELDGIGAEYNAFTGEEYTGYHAKAEAAHINQLIDVVTDLYVGPVFDSKEIEKEKGVIIEELNMYEDIPMRKVAEVFTALLYGNQPAGWPIGGEKDIIRRLSREDIVSYRAANYMAKSTAVIVVGGFEEKSVLRRLETALASIDHAKKMKKLPVKEAQVKPALALKFKESDQTHLILGVRAYDTYDSRRHALTILAEILGGGMSSRLFQRIRDEMGAAYYIRAGVEALTDHGYFAVSAGVEHGKLESVLGAILEEMKRIAAGDFTAEELKRAEEHAAGGLVLGLETSDALAGYYGAEEVLRKPITSPETHLRRLRMVTKRKVIAVARDIFKSEKLNLALIGPQKNSALLQKILHF